MDTAARTARSGQARRVAWAMFLGTTIEWYDFFLYGTAAALIFSKQFFPGLDPVIGSIAAFGTLAAGFVARPLGGMVFGHFGDRFGRRNTLIVSLLVMGVGTTLIGLLPTYGEWGVWAPLLLVALRVVQGIGLGGEWGGAVVLTLEHAPEKRRGLYGSFPQMGTPAGLVLANAVFLGCSAVLGQERFLAWGWRVPFVLSIALVGVGLYLRLHIAESPAYAAVAHGRRQARMPLLTVLRDHWRAVVHAALVIIGNSSAAYVFMVFVLSYGQHAKGLDNTFLLACVIGGSVLWLVSAPLWAHIGDRRGLRTVFVQGSLIRMVWCLAFFPIIDSGAGGPIVVLMLSMGLVLSMTNSPIGTLTAGFFPVEVRYSGTSVAYQIGSLLGGGVTPLIAASLYAATTTSWAITGYLLVIGVLSLVAAFAIPSE